MSFLWTYINNEKNKKYNQTDEYAANDIHYFNQEAWTMIQGNLDEK